MTHSGDSNDQECASAILQGQYLAIECLGDGDKVEVSIKRDIYSLTEQNKMTRRRALEKIGKETIEKKQQHPNNVLGIIFDEIYKPVLKLYDDPVDRTRETAINLTFKFFKVLENREEYLAYIIPTIHQRLTSDEDSEPTEEIRLLLMEKLNTLVDLCGEKCSLYIDELVQILQKSVVDSFADVRKESCACINKLSQSAPQPFYHQGESLINPLLQSLSHQHNKVRVAVLKTIGVVVNATSGKTVDDVFTHIAQRTFDHSPPVRLAVTEVVGGWLLELRDRYSFFSKLIPLLLSGFSDEMPEIQQKSKEFYKNAGQLYEEENESDFKEKKEYRTVKHFERFLDYDRPSFGCRALIQRNFSKILPAIINDITDWAVSTRLKTASLLYHLVFFCEDEVTMHMELLSQGLYKAAQDEEKAVFNEVIKTAELVGLFVEPSVYCKLIIPHLESISSTPNTLASSLQILAAYIRHANYELLDDETEGICAALVNPDVCSTVNKACQESVLACTDALIQKTGINHSKISCALFKTLLNITALATNEHVKTKVLSQMDSLCRALNMNTRSELFEMYGEDILNPLKSSCNNWTSQSADFHLFVALLSECGSSLGKFLAPAMEIFKQCCDVSRDPEMKQRMFTVMSHLVLSVSSDDEIRKGFHDYTLSLIQDTILPNCTWQAGRIAAAVRSVVISFLWSMLESCVITNEHLQECFKDVHTQIIACLDDYNETTRLVTVKVMLKLLKVCKGAFHVEQLHTIYPELLKRLDDSSDGIRIMTTKALSAYFSAIPVDYDKEFFKVHLEFIFKTLLVHLDDPDEDVQNAVFECLQIGAPVHPGLLKMQVEDVRNKHRRKRHCDELIKCCENLLHES